MAIPQGKLVPTINGIGPPLRPGNPLVISLDLGRQQPGTRPLNPAPPVQKATSQFGQLGETTSLILRSNPVTALACMGTLVTLLAKAIPQAWWLALYRMSPISIAMQLSHVENTAPVHRLIPDSHSLSGVVIVDIVITKVMAKVFKVSNPLPTRPPLQQNVKTQKNPHIPAALNGKPILNNTPPRN